MDLLLSVDVDFSCDDVVRHRFPPFLQQSESLERPGHPPGEMMRPQSPSSELLALPVSYLPKSRKNCEKASVKKNEINEKMMNE